MKKSFYAQHQDLLKQIIMEAQNHFPNLRLFAATNGLFYTKNGTPVKVGTVGQADLNGWITVNGIAIRIEVEVKSGKILIKKNSAQDRWRSICIKMGVIHIVATSPSQFVENLKEQLNERRLLLQSGH